MAAPKKEEKAMPLGDRVYKVHTIMLQQISHKLKKTRGEVLRDIITDTHAKVVKGQVS